ncbi:MAG: potassium-transporting ATPase subunit KdpC [Parachlamydiaceae bacterium]|nr:potassium-transporting ATPase subunit KdpC [Parachlamydiaceae bacterium]
MNKFLKSLRIFAWMTLLTGIIYPLFITLIAQVTMKQKADGGFLISQNKIVGAKLIAQKFESDKYFLGRPSAKDYNPLPSGGSNFGPTSAKLKKAVNERREQIAKSHNVEKDKIPSELLFASGSGLDPHVSLVTAYFQMERVAKARGLKNEDLKHIIDQTVLKRRFGFIGEPCVNILVLNTTLDEFLKLSEKK